MNPARLAAERAILRFVSDRFFASVQIARAPRSKPDSGFVPGLEEPERPRPERQEQDEPPRSRRAGQDQSRRDQGAAAEHDDAYDDPLPPLARADVGSRVHAQGEAGRSPRRTSQVVTIPETSRRSWVSEGWMCSLLIQISSFGSRAAA